MMGVLTPRGKGEANWIFELQISSVEVSSSILEEVRVSSNLEMESLARQCSGPQGGGRDGGRDGRI